MRRSLATAALAAGLLGPLAPVRAQGTPDPAAAEKQYRLAQRLGADGSADAAAAFEKVVTLAPSGPYADDALVDLARLSGSPEWPEDLGELDAARAARARASLERVTSTVADGDRAPEARYRLALLRLAPLPGRDPARARQDLIALAAGPLSERWAVAARYVLGVLDEQGGATDRAAGAFARVVVERPDGDIAVRAKAGYGRTLLAGGRFGEAAGWLQEAVDGGGAAPASAAAHRQLAVREVLAQRVPARRWESVAAPLPVTATTKSADRFAADAAGRLIVFDRKEETLRAFDAGAPVGSPVPLPGVTALASDPFGRVFVATKDKVVRWDAGKVVTVAALGSFGSPSAIAVEVTGSIWIADRRGDRIARWDVGSAAPVVVRESKGSGVTALAISLGRVIAAEEKTGRLVSITAAGAESAFGSVTFKRPIALTADAAGRVAVLDEKSESVTRLAASGQVMETLATGEAGVSEPAALVATAAGAVLILDADSGAVAVSP